MKILVTSGGTKIPIDRVRHIANMSRGTFGARITKALVEEVTADVEVIFLHAKGSKLPVFSAGAFEVMPTNLTMVEFDTFWDYAGKLEDICKTQKPDLVLLAAAVSDYEVQDPVDGKVRTGGDLVIRLKPLPKLISRVREWCGPQTSICGFKLLVDSTQSELVQAGIKSFYGNDLDMVVCNDLRDIKADNHILHLISRFFRDTEDRGDMDLLVLNSRDDHRPTYLAEQVAARALAVMYARQEFRKAIQ